MIFFPVIFPLSNHLARMKYLESLLKDKDDKVLPWFNLKEELYVRQYHLWMLYENS